MNKLMLFVVLISGLAGAGISRLLTGQSGQLAYYQTNGTIASAAGTSFDMRAQTLTLRPTALYDGLRVESGRSRTPPAMLGRFRPTPGPGDPLLFLGAQGQLPDGGFQTGGGLIFDAAESWSAVGYGTAADLFITPQGRSGVGLTLVHLEPRRDRPAVGLGPNANQFPWWDLDATVQIRNQADGRFAGPPPGPTKLVIQMGVAQGPTPLLEIQDQGGQPLFRIPPDGWPEVRAGGGWRKVALQ